MFRPLLRTFLILSVSLACTAAMADAYFGGSFSRLDYKYTEAHEDVGIADGIEAKPWAISARLGYEVDDNFSAELRAGRGMDTEDVNLMGENAEFDVSSLYGAYLRGGLPFDGGLFPYVIIGRTHAVAELRRDGLDSVSDSLSDFSYGIGIDIETGNNFVLNAEYMLVLDDGPTSLDLLTVGAVVKF